MTATETKQKITVPYYDKNGTRLKGLELPENAFGISEVNRAVLFDAIIMYEANKRIGSANTKTRSEITGTNKKPYRQKGTGRARHGSAKSPIWRGGGIVFGPKPRDYSYSMPKKQKRLALKSALLSKFIDREVRVIEDLEFENPSTKQMHQLLGKMQVGAESCLLGLDHQKEEVLKSIRNIPRKEVEHIRNFNAHQLLKNQKLVLTKSAYEALLGGNDE